MPVQHVLYMQSCVLSSQSTQCRVDPVRRSWPSKVTVHTLFYIYVYNSLQKQSPTLEYRAFDIGFFKCGLYSIARPNLLRIQIFKKFNIIYFKSNVR